MDELLFEIFNTSSFLTNTKNFKFILLSLQDINLNDSKIFRWASEFHYSQDFNRPTQISVVSLINIFENYAPEYLLERLKVVNLKIFKKAKILCPLIERNLNFYISAIENDIKIYDEIVFSFILYFLIFI